MKAYILNRMLSAEDGKELQVPVAIFPSKEEPVEEVRMSDPIIDMYLTVIPV